MGDADDYDVRARAWWERSCEAVKQDLLRDVSIVKHELSEATSQCNVEQEKKAGPPKSLLKRMPTLVRSDSVASISEVSSNIVESVENGVENLLNPLDFSKVDFAQAVPEVYQVLKQHVIEREKAVCSFDGYQSATALDNLETLSKKWSNASQGISKSELKRTMVNGVWQATVKAPSVSARKRNRPRKLQIQLPDSGSDSDSPRRSWGLVANTLRGARSFKKGAASSDDESSLGGDSGTPTTIKKEKTNKYFVEILTPTQKTFKHKTRTDLIAQWPSLDRIQDMVRDGARLKEGRKKIRKGSLSDSEPEDSGSDTKPSSTIDVGGGGKSSPTIGVGGGGGVRRSSLRTSNLSQFNSRKRNSNTRKDSRGRLSTAEILESDAGLHWKLSKKSSIHFPSIVNGRKKASHSSLGLHSSPSKGLFQEMDAPKHPTYHLSKVPPRRWLKKL